MTPPNPGIDTGDGNGDGEDGGDTEGSGNGRDDLIGSLGRPNGLGSLGEKP